MIQPARRAGLGDEARRGVLLPDEVRVDDLDRDRPAEVRLLRAVDAPHSSDPDERINLIPVEGTTNQVIWIL